MQDNYFNMASNQGATETTTRPFTNSSSHLSTLFDGPPTDHKQSTTSNDSLQKTDDDVYKSETSYLIAIDDMEKSQKASKHHQQQNEDQNASGLILDFICTKMELGTPGTWIGSLIFLLYHVVFCLAQASAFTRPNADHSSTGRQAQYAALGVWTAGPAFIYWTGDYVPAVYPASDLFLSVFLAEVVKRVDEVLAQHGLQNDDTIFFATFSALVASGMVLSGILCLLAARIKLANLGNFLPYPVLTGFFSTIGILMWSLGFSIDTNGMSPGQVCGSGDWNVIQRALTHHAPSFMVGVIIHITSKRHPLFVMFWILATVFGAYICLFITGTTLKQAQTQKWFFSLEELQGPIANPIDDGNDSNLSSFTLREYGPEYPFGVWWSVLQGQVHLEAFLTGMPTMLALCFLYLLRCSLHSAALKKNIPNLTRAPPPGVSSPRRSIRGSSVKESENKIGAVSLGYLLEKGYAYSQLVSAILGGVTVAPSLAASLTMFHLGAEKVAPQYGSCFLLIYFYLNQFTLVQYIPKPAFSCLMVLAGIDMSRTWLYDSYFKTKAKLEWLVAPFLVIMAFVVGLLNAIFLGIGISTFIFIGSFYRAGSVKFVGNGLSLRSTVERGFEESAWLSQKGDLIQILVLQNYIFFGNGQSVLNYVMTMFEDMPADDDEDASKDDDDLVIPPIPKHLIIDFTMVTGMDTSAVDVFSEIVKACRSKKCKLYLAGLDKELKAMLVHAGVRPVISNKSGVSVHNFSWQFDLESALAKSEDALLSDEFHLEEKAAIESSERQGSTDILGQQNDEGLIYALTKIDEQHGLDSAVELASLAPYTTVLTLVPGDILSRADGLYFVETGLMHVQSSATLGTHASTAASSRTDTTSVGSNDRSYDNSYSIGHLNARSSTLGRQTALWKESQRKMGALESPGHAFGGGGGMHGQSFRLARIGHGWIIGSIELATHGMKRPGVHVAVSPCRLHHLPVAAVAQVEKEHPVVALNLYKLLAHLSAKRQEMTIDQLGQFVHILNSPTPRLRGGKTGLAKLQNQSHFFNR